MDRLELTILMPCLNEAKTVGTCVRKAMDYLEKSGISGEVLIADNNSEDASRDIAEKLGARVIRVDQRGYGVALRAGIAEAKGTYVIFGDADDSYDFSALDPFVEKLRAGYDLVVGDRFAGGIEEGAMKALHRSFGVPFLSFVGRAVSGAKVRDFHCGLRGISREAAAGLELKTKGMEFASEIIVKAERAGLSVCQVPTKLYRDGRCAGGSPDPRGAKVSVKNVSEEPSGASGSHLRSWRDGCRHLFFLLSYKDGIGPVIALISATIWMIIAVENRGEGEFLFPFIVIGIVGCFCAVKNFLVREERPRGRRQRIIRAGALLFALSVVAAHYELFLRIQTGSGKAVLSALTIPVVLCAAYVLAWHMQVRLYRVVREQAAGQEKEQGRDRGKSQSRAKGRKLSGEKVSRIAWWPGLLTFVLVAVVFGGFLFLCQYPGVLSNDSIEQLRQIMTGTYDNHHPYWHTLGIRFLLGAGELLTGSTTGGVAFFSFCQILFMAAVFAYAAQLVFRLTGSRTAWLLVTVFFLVMPYNAVLSVTMWKDVPFSLSTLLFVCALVRLTQSAGTDDSKESSAGERGIHHLLLLIGAVGMCLLRTNGWIVFLITTIAAAAMGKRYRKLLAVFVVVLVVTAVMRGPVLTQLHVAPAEADEGLGVFWQQIGRVVAKDEGLTEEQRHRLDQLIDVDKIPDTYKEYIYDPLKWLEREKDTDKYLIDHKKEFLSLWADIGRDHPGTYLAAWIQETKGFWNGGYYVRSWGDSVQENEWGIRKRPAVSPGLSNAFWTYENLFYMDGLNVFISIGLVFWLICLLLSVCLQLRTRAIYFVPVLANTVTLLAAAPNGFEFRYVYMQFLLLPVLLAVTLWAGRETTRCGRGRSTD